MANEKKDYAANWTPGVQLKITTLANGEVEGEVFTYDATTDALVLGIISISILFLFLRVV